jgi:hypothetical protein
MLKKALGELRPPVGGDKVRARMVALLGREDPMLDPAQFGRLLRQANDAEVADVRKIGEDKYEVSPHRTQVRTEAAQRREGAVAEAEQTGTESGMPPSAEPAAAAGRVAAVRFRRGSRGGALRRAEIPLIGAVRMETQEPAKVAKAEKPAKPEKPVKAEKPAKAPAKEGKPARRGRGRGKAKEPPKE